MNQPPPDALATFIALMLIVSLIAAWVVTMGAVLAS